MNPAEVSPKYTLGTRAIVSQASRRFVEVNRKDPQGEDPNKPGLIPVYLALSATLIRTVQLQSSTTQIESTLRFSGGTGRPRSPSIFRISWAVSGCGMADCTPTRTRPSE